MTSEPQAGATPPGIFALIRRGLSMLISFGGRDTRRQFWSFALPVVGIGWFVQFATTFPMLFGQIFAGLARADEMSRANPQDWVVRRSPGSVHYQYVGNDPAVMAQMMPDFGAFLAVTMAVALVVVLLLAAAVTRRLHDRGHSGAWALVPAVLLAIGMVAMMRLTDTLGGMTNGNMAGFFGSFVTMFVVNIAYLATLAVLIVQCAMAGVPTPNRYGEPPQV